MQNKPKEINNTETCDDPKASSAYLVSLQLKKSITTILNNTISGREKKYLTQFGHIKWGLVEKDIHKIIDDVMQ